MAQPKSIIEDLEEQVEYWRARAEAAEMALKTEDWSVARRPLTLQMTRILRIIERKPTNLEQITRALEFDYPSITQNSVKVRISTMRQLLPAGVMPVKQGGAGHVYMIGDAEIARHFLATGELPEVRRAA